MYLCEIENMLMKDLINGFPDDVIVNMENPQEEFSELLFVWSQNRKDPVALHNAMSRFIANMVIRTAAKMEHDEVSTEELAEMRWESCQDRKIT